MDVPHWARASLHQDGGSTEQPGGPDPSIMALLRDDEAGDDLKWPARLAPARLARAILLRWPIVLATTIAAAVLGIALALVLVQKRWESSVTLIMQDRSEELSVGGGQPYRPRAYTLETLVDAIKLPSSLDETLQRAGVAASRLDLASSIDLSLAQKSDILNLKVIWSDPAQSASLANALGEVFVERTGRIRRDQAAAAYDGYQRQLQDAQSRVRAADAEILRFQLENQVTDFEEEIKARLIDLSRLQAEYWSQAAEAEALAAARADLAAWIEQQPEQQTTTVFRNPLQKRLEEYEWDLEQALSRYTEENPKVVKLTQQVEALRALAVEAGPNGAEPIRSPNDLRRDLQVKLQDVTERARVAQARAAGLETSIAQQNDKLASLSTLEKKFRQLESNQQTTRELERSLAGKMEEARVAMSSGDSSLRIVERALAPTDPLPGNRRLVALAFLLLGAAVGAGVALLLELLDPKVRCLADVGDWAPDVPVVELPSSSADPLEPVPASDPSFRLYRRLAGDLSRVMPRGGAVALASAGGNEGRSSVARGLAVAHAVRGERSLLIDGDARTGAGRRAVACQPDRPGLLQLVRKEVSLTDVVYQDVIERLQAVPAGSLDEAPDEALLQVGQPVFASTIASLAAGSERTLVDLPPCGLDEGAFEAITRIGAAVIVARCGLTCRTEARANLERLLARGVQIVAVVLIDVPAARLATTSWSTLARLMLRSLTGRMQVPWRKPRVA